MALLAVLAATAGVALIGVSPAGAATLNVTLGGTDDGCADSTFTTISSAITCAANGDTITVGPGTFNEQVIIDKDVSIVGSGVGVTVIDGLGATNLPTQGQVRIATSGDVTISNLTVANPGANSASAGHYGIFARGVGVATATGTWTISQVRIDGGGLTPFGLGVYCFGNADNAADLVLQDSTIENNRGNLLLMENCTGSFTATGNTFTQSLVADSLIFAMRYDGRSAAPARPSSSAATRSPGPLPAAAPPACPTTGLAPCRPAARRWAGSPGSRSPTTRSPG